MTSLWNLKDGWAPRPLAGEVALVTGSLGGLGRPITMGLAAAGAAVAVHHLGEQAEADEFVEELTSHGVSAIAVQADVTDWGATAAMFTSIRNALGSVSVLVNNAGMMRKQRFTEMTREDWDETIDIDLGGVFTATRLALPAMLEAGRGSVINMSSQLAFKGAYDYVSYSAAKAGVAGLTRALAREVGPDVRVNAVAPGPIATPMTDEIATPEWVEERTSGAVLRRLGTPDEIVSAVVFLASSGAQLMQGQVLHLNGGGVMS